MLYGQNCYLLQVDYLSEINTTLENVPLNSYENKEY